MMCIDISAGMFAAVLWASLCITLVALMVLWGLWRAFTRRTDAMIGREDISAIVERRKDLRNE